jgi:hypothetical protein
MNKNIELALDGKPLLYPSTYTPDSLKFKSFSEWKVSTTFVNPVPSALSKMSLISFLALGFYIT